MQALRPTAAMMTSALRTARHARLLLRYGNFLTENNKGLPRKKISGYVELLYVTTYHMPRMARLTRFAGFPKLYFKDPVAGTYESVDDGGWSHLSASIVVY